MKRGVETAPVGFAGGLQEFAIAAAIPIGMKFDLLERLTKPGLQAPHLLGSFAVGRGELQGGDGRFTGKITRFGGNQFHAQVLRHGLDQGPRRSRHDHQPVSLLVVPAKPGNSFGSQPLD